MSSVDYEMSDEAWALLVWMDFMAWNGVWKAKSKRGVHSIQIVFLVQRLAEQRVSMKLNGIELVKM
jgi:hypothetical protein